jgi:hypothetical protein
VRCATLLGAPRAAVMCPIRSVSTVLHLELKPPKRGYRSRTVAVARTVAASSSRPNLDDAADCASDKRPLRSAVPMATASRHARHD